jgi:zinc transport system substrate-binding protein
MVLLRLQVLILAIGCMPLVSCRAELKTGQPAGEIVLAFVTLLPQADFVRRVGGSHVRVGVLVGPGQSHHSYEPTPRQIAELSESQLYFRIGVPLEGALLPKISASARSLRIVDTREGVALRSFEGCNHGPGGAHGEHAEGQLDPHIWLDPRLVAIQAEHICKALCDLDSTNAGEYRTNLLAFQGELSKLHQRISQRLAPFTGQDIFVFHPAYGYFADAYGLKQVAIEAEGKEPEGKQLAGLIDRARKSKASVILIQPQFASASAHTIAGEIGAKVVELDPLPRDYIKDMERMSEIVAESFSGSGGEKSRLSPND